MRIDACSRQMSSHEPWLAPKPSVGDSPSRASKKDNLSGSSGVKPLADNEHMIAKDPVELPVISQFPMHLKLKCQSHRIRLTKKLFFIIVAAWHLG